MKIARIEHASQTSYAAVEPDGYTLIEGDLFGDWKLTKRTVPVGQARLLPPVVPPQIICIGANYRKHCIECGAPIPESPIVFFKLISALAGPGDAVVLPKVAPSEVDWEAELVIVIGKQGKHIPPERAKDYILGYTCGNDVSARDCQLRLDKQWARGKSFDTFAPIGPCIATGLDGDRLDIRLSVNGRELQNSNTSDMIFSCGYLVSYLSQCMTLLPGSIIMTGTPSGVGMGRKPQVFLKSGDTMTVEIEGIGQLTNPVVAET